MSGPLDAVRGSCRRVAERARHVRIVEEKIPAYASALAARPASLPELDPDCHVLGRGKETAAFMLTLEAVNFGSGYFPHLRRTEASSGYFTIARALADRYRRAGPMTAAELAGIGVEECFAIFGQDPENAPIRELMTLFARAWNQLGSHLLETCDGSFVALIEAAGGRAERLVELLSAMPFFDDRARYDDLDVAFYKRAQLTAADLSLAFGGEGLGRFEDLADLTIFADDLVPHVLRVDGVLCYDDTLAHRIDRGDLLPAGSASEIEIRACAIHAVERLLAELRRTRPASAMAIDYVLWNRGLGAAYSATPRHRTRTVFY